MSKPAEPWGTHYEDNPSWGEGFAAGRAAERERWERGINEVMAVRIRPGGSMRAATLDEIHSGLHALVAAEQPAIGD